ncbi:hypothetical protein EU800_08625 [Tropicimonas sp. IMCC6043]|nr:hypothetical protein EU800_08625 [Tropicimonas sp. IMCC6043]
MAPVMVVSVIVVIAVLARFLWLVFRARNPYRLSILAYTIFGCLVVFYYGLLFGAAHFISRYLAPLTPLLILAAVTVLIDLARRLGHRGPAVASYLGSSALVLSMLLLLRFVIPDLHPHLHFQVVDWVEENLDKETWVGAIQTGTVGFWHDRTINLDGKTNPEALRTRLEDGDVLDYVVDSDIVYLADWVVIVGWTDMGNQRFSSNFEVLVEDRDNNLGVLRRIGSGRPPAAE